ncbi:MAG TPA: hypothetical protein DEF59_03055 [Candidatus Magasanikbacteria bacterium]|nr:hypothetical protein [Candidatus Magasanikbacteria bacterium]
MAMDEGKFCGKVARSSAEGLEKNHAASASAATRIRPHPKLQLHPRRKQERSLVSGGCSMGAGEWSLIG